MYIKNKCKAATKATKHNNAGKHPSSNPRHTKPVKNAVTKTPKTQQNPTELINILAPTSMNRQKYPPKFKHPKAKTYKPSKI